MDVLIQSKRPKGSAFRQQRLTAWQPILTAGTVLPTFFLIGLAFIPIGCVLIICSDAVNEEQIDYTDCLEYKSNVSCKTLLENHLFNGTSQDFSCICHENINLKTDFSAHVFVYYGLSNFYQNHRRYVKSRSDRQLRGNPKSVSLDCAPFDKDASGLPIAPCGAIANSLFNDTIRIERKMGKDSWVEVELLKNNISWPTDRKVKYADAVSYEGTAKPPAWKHTISEIGGFTNEALLVWMRTAALPTFRKLYGRVNHDKQDFSILPKGEYRAVIDYNYPVSKFKGTKRVILSNTSWIGGKNPFLGIAYITVGSLCLVLGFVFLFIHHKYGKNQRMILDEHDSRKKNLRAKKANSQALELVQNSRL